jgi:hypothetical protein
MRTSLAEGRRRWPLLALAACVAVPAALSLQGCSSTFCRRWCATECVSHVITIHEATCDDRRRGLTSTPGSITVRGGHVVHIVNASPCDVEFEARPAVGFQIFDGVPGNRFSLRAGEVRVLTAAKKVSPTKVVLSVTTRTPGCMPCPLFAGPGVEIDG